MKNIHQDVHHKIQEIYSVYIEDNHGRNNTPYCLGGLKKLLRIKPWPNGPASSYKWTQVELV